MRRPSRTLHVVLCCIHLSYGVPLFAVGLFLCCTIIGIPVGAPLMVLSGVGLAYEQKRRVEALIKYERQISGGPATKPGKRNQILQKLDFEGYTYEYDPDLDRMVPIEKPW